MIRLRACAKARPAGALLLALLLSAGCLPGGRGKVTGTVTYQGKPLTGGTVMFFDKLNRVHQSPITPNGVYLVDDVATGAARIAVQVPMNIPFKGLDGKGTDAKTAAVQIPGKYGSPDTSELTCSVTRGPQKFDIQLKE